MVPSSLQIVEAQRDVDGQGAHDRQAYALVDHRSSCTTEDAPTACGAGFRLLFRRCCLATVPPRDHDSEDDVQPAEARAIYQLAQGAG